MNPYKEEKCESHCGPPATVTGQRKFHALNRANLQSDFFPLHIYIYLRHMIRIEWSAGEYVLKSASMVGDPAPKVYAKHGIYNLV